MALNVDLGNLVGHLKLDNKQWQSSLRSSAATLTRTMSNMARTTARWGKRFAVIYGAASVKALASFQDELAFVNTMLDEQTQKYLPQYAKAMKDMSIVFGESTKTMSRGLYDILSASIPAEKAIGVLTDSVKAARAGMTTTALAADVITTMLNAYNLEATQAGDVSDLLFAIVKRGKTTFGDLGGSIGMVASNAAVAGVSMEELGTAIAVMTRAGLKTDIAVTALRQLIALFTGKPSEDAQTAARQLGLTLTATTLRAEGLVSILKALKNANEEQLSAIIPNVRAYTGFATMLQKVTDIGTDMEMMLNRAGMTQEAYLKTTASLGHNLRQLWSIIKILTVELGKGFEKAIRDLVDYLVENRDAMQAWATNVAGRIDMIIDKFRGLASLMVTDMPTAMQAMWDMFLTTMRAAADVAFDLAFRMGQGIWKGVKAGVFGSRETRINERAWEIYRSKPGGTWRTEVRDVPGLELMGTKTIRENIPNRPELFAQAKALAEAEIGKELADSVMAGFPERMQQIWSDYTADMKTTMSVFAREGGPSWWDKWSDKASSAFDRVKEKIQPVVDALQELNDKQRKLYDTATAQKQTGPFGWNMQILRDFVKQSDDLFMRLQESAAGAIQSLSDTLAEAAVKGSADFKRMAQSILQDVASVMIRAQMVRFMYGLFPGFAPVKAAKGMVINGPHVIPMQAGGILAGEAGTEGIFPLARTAEGELGIKSAGSGLELNMHYEGMPLRVSRQEEYMASDRRIVDVWLSAIDTEPELRRAVKGATRG